MNTVTIENHQIFSRLLNRNVAVDLYLNAPLDSKLFNSLLLVNDGQHLAEMDFAAMLQDKTADGTLPPLVCVGIHASEDRKNEYGTAKILNYLGQGTTAAAYQQFLVEELLPFIQQQTGIENFAHKAIAGFSLGGLSALDTVWNHPQLFQTAGVFSGSLWWRTKSLEEDYNEETDRIMHRLVKEGVYTPGLQFYFTTGSMDETADRNNNGIIDSIDDTLGLIRCLEDLGYEEERDFKYLNYEDGRHDIATWGRAMPHFLEWAWATKPVAAAGPESC